MLKIYICEASTYDHSLLKQKRVCYWNAITNNTSVITHHRTTFILTRNHGNQVTYMKTPKIIL